MKIIVMIMIITTIIIIILVIIIIIMMLVIIIIIIKTKRLICREVRTHIHIKNLPLSLSNVLLSLNLSKKRTSIDISGCH